MFDINQFMEELRKKFPDADVNLRHGLTRVVITVFRRGEKYVFDWDFGRMFTSGAKIGEGGVSGYFGKVDPEKAAGDFVALLKGE
jgi:hypothetical protein